MTPFRQYRPPLQITALFAQLFFNLYIAMAYAELVFQDFGDMRDYIRIIAFDMTFHRHIMFADTP